MASILTNASAMTALQTLRKVTGDLETTQDRISTGMKVATASDNAAYWSIATTMKSDVAGFKAVSDALGLGSSTAISAANGADSVKDMLTEMKQRIVAAQSKGTDPKFIQDEVNQFIGQIEGIVNAASFNGDNWLKVSYSPDGSAKDLNVDVLSTLSRTSSGVVPSYISFQRQDMRSDSVVGQATIEQEVESTVASKASLVFDVGTATGTFIDGQNLGLDKMSFSFTTEAMTVNYVTNGILDNTGAVGTPTVANNATALVLQPITFSVDVDLSSITYDTDQATTEAKIVKTINDAIAKQSYAAMIPSIVDQSKAAAVTAERGQVVKDVSRIAEAQYLTANVNDFAGAKSYAKAASEAAGAAFDRGDAAFNYALGAGNLFTTAVDFSAATASANSIAGAQASVATMASTALGAAAPTDYASASGLLKDRILSVSFATVDSKRQLQFTVAGGYQTPDFSNASFTNVAAVTNWATTGNVAADSNYTSKIAGVWMETKESDAFGGLADLKQLDMQNNAARSLTAIDSMLTKVIEKGAVLGSIENRIGIQTDFLSKLTDSMNKGIGLLVDADLTEESSRLQALQVQQQLATQALSIANQGPQNILSLFR